MENSLALARQRAGKTKELIAENEAHHQRKTWFANYYWLLFSRLYFELHNKQGREETERPQRKIEKDVSARENILAKIL
jgi:hypothetical protein